MKIKQAVILCGGLGIRLRLLTNRIPKPMVEVNGKPFLYYLINQCKKNGIKNFLILTGYKEEIIKKYFKNGKKLKVKIKYSYSHYKTKTLNRVLFAKNLLKNNFILLYGDNYASLNLHRVLNIYNKTKEKMLITIAKKKPGNIFLNNKLKIKKYLFKKSKTCEYVEIGYILLNKEILKNYNIFNKNISFNYLLENEIKKNNVLPFFHEEGYLSISDKKRLNITKKNFSKKIVLVDRDGVLNYKNNNHFYVRNLKELRINYKLIKKILPYIKNFKLLCISNQAGISTGDLSKKNLNIINSKILYECKKIGLKIMDFFVSTQHYNSNHFDRKPNPGLFLRASKKYKFALDQTCYIGDDIRDIESAYRANTYCYYVGKEKLKNYQTEKYKNVLIKNLKNLVINK